MDRLPDIYDQGFKAYGAGDCCNPHQPGSDEANAWDTGWWDGQAASANHWLRQATTGED